jgi:hypothetical protein
MWNNGSPGSTAAVRQSFWLVMNFVGRCSCRIITQSGGVSIKAEPPIVIDGATKWTLFSSSRVVTTAFTLFGVLRFLHLVRRDARSDSPTEEMLRDKPFLANLVLWVVAVVAVIYFG